MKEHVTDTLNRYMHAIEDIAEHEAKALWRLARTAGAKGCDPRLVAEIQMEGWKVWDARSDAYLLIDPFWRAQFHYAFRLGGGN